MRILLIGANGQLAHDLSQVLLNDEVIGLTHVELDICDRDRLFETVNQLRPDCLINTAAFHRVDDCEDQPAKAFEVNAVAVRHVVEVANRIGAVPVHFGTDYVFDATQRRPCTETDVADPFSVYGISKLAGEMIVSTYALASRDSKNSVFEWPFEQYQRYGIVREYSTSDPPASVGSQPRDADSGNESSRPLRLSCRMSAG